jgi:carbamate kinase
MEHKNESERHSVKPKKKIVIALGGNAIIENGKSGSFEEQFFNIRKTAGRIVAMAMKADDFEIVALTHGNGPQVGNIALQQDIASTKIPRQPLHALIAMTQGQLGYMMQQALQNEFMKAGVRRPVVSIVTQTIVDKNDPEFFKETPSKPIGPFYTPDEARQIAEHNQYIIVKVKPSGERIWRRVVPSPTPIRIVESGIITKLVEEGCFVIASGGGGIPVTQDDGGYVGVDGVIDKDLVAGLLATSIGASILLILTDIDKVKLNFGKPNEAAVSQLSLEEAKQHLAAGQFPEGSMGPKISSSIGFLESGGEAAIITSIDNAVAALHGEAGTRIVNTST